MEEKSFVYELSNGKKLTRNKFIDYFEKKVFKTIAKYELIKKEDKKIVVATSGGKDSISVLYLTKKYLKKRNSKAKLISLCIDEGIKNYREKTINFLKNFCKKQKIILKVKSYKKIFGEKLDTYIKKIKNTNISACNICGTFRRNSLNIEARKLKADKVITGHNLDDEAQTILLNIFKNNFSILARLGPENGVIKDKMFIPRVKPLYFMKEKEIRLYTILKNFDVGYDECPHSKGSFREKIRDVINELEDKSQGTKNSIVNFYLEIKKELEKKYSKEKRKITKCEICKEPSQKKICNTCQLKKKLN